MKRSCSIGKVAQAVLDPRCDGIRDVLIALDDPVKAHEEAIAMGVGVIGVEVCGPDVLKKNLKAGSKPISNACLILQRLGCS